MTMQTPIRIDDSGWDVPAHDTAIYAGKRHTHALVIPVINEGERIRAQLLRIKAAQLPVDVIVADGGSTDGSLDPAFVQSADVRAVLTKTGPGKLSAQLRIAYAWCLRQGYEGIVTIDGNGKDGVDAVADMVARLEQGFDYVQGSRYLPGGAAENTPLERHLANRLIHAPLLSVAGRHWFTDTTNGFRAYSARYLMHPDVRPFRDEFRVYNLLFYLTVRAGQLGLKVAHVPVVRAYPESGKVPTKIGGFASKLALLAETLVAATGGHTPDDAVRRPPALTWPLLAVLLLTAPLFLSLVVFPPYSPDSWALYELAQTVFGDFYRFSHWRSYASGAPYSAAFPPLYPVLIAVVDAVLGTGARTGLYLAFAFYAAFALVSEKIGRRVTGAPWLGLAAVLPLLLGHNMLLAELGAGRTIPLQLLLYALVLLALLKGERIGLAGAAGIGFLTGLAILNRFDAALLPLLAAALVWWLTRKPGRALALLAAAAVTLSPWIWYSLATFGSPFATDNAGIATSLDRAAFVTDWWPGPRPTLADDPLAWGARIGANVIECALTGVALLVGPMGLVAAAFLAVPASLAGLVRLGPQAMPARRRVAPALRIMAGFVLILAVLLAPQVLTGYLENRYFAASLWAALLAAACWGIAQGRTRHQRMIFGRIAFAVVAVAILPVSVAQLVHTARAGQLDAGRWARFDAPADVRTLQACVQHAPGARILVLGDDGFAAQAGALGGLATMMEPRNMARGRLGAAGSRAFIATWHVDYVLVKDAARTRFATTTFDLERVAACPMRLYRVR